MGNEPGKMEGVVMEQNLFGGVYKNKTIAVTGNTGFKGSWLALWLEALGAHVHGFSLDDHGSNSHFNILKPGYPTRFADLRNKKDLSGFIRDTQPDLVFHLAAQSLVRESYRQPFDTYETNILGTLNLLEAAQSSPGVQAVVNVTTDKVYQNISSPRGYKETDPLGGHDMYSSSKACSEILTESYRKSFLSDTAEPKYLLASARAGNVIGGGDWAADRLVPDVMRAVCEKKACSIRNPGSVRPWQHVLEPLSGYLLLGQALLEKKRTCATAWNFGPQKNDSASVSDMLGLMQKRWNGIRWNPEKPEQDLHEAALLQLDSSKAEKDLGWSPVWNLEQTVNHTLQWYKSYLEKQDVRSHEDLRMYVADATLQKKSWCP